MDSYQAIYDAVRSRISNGDIGRAVEEVMRNCNFSHYAEQAYHRASEAVAESARPFYLLRPKIFIDGDAWCALYGENLQDGVAGFGKSPYEAAYAFDRAWETKLPTAIDTARSGAKEAGK